jgi:hypothetical protein
MTEQNCLTCRFWERNGFADTPNEDSFSDCLRYPPTVIGYDWNNYVSREATPETLGSHWCGEWVIRDGE